MEDAMALPDVPLRDRIIAFSILCGVIVLALSAAIIETIILPFVLLAIVIKRPKFSNKKISYDWLSFITRNFSIIIIFQFLILTFESKEVIDLL